MIKLNKRAGSNKKATKYLKERTSQPKQKIGKLLFSFQFMQPEYCIRLCQKDDKAAFADQLRILGSMTWNDAYRAPKHGAGCEKISRHSITKPIPPHITEDVNFYSFRFSGKKPMIGYREENVFHVIWLDRDYSVYNHG